MREGLVLRLCCQVRHGRKRHVGACNQGHGEAVFQTIAIAFQCFLGARDIAGRGSTMVFTYSVKRAVSLVGL